MNSPNTAYADIEQQRSEFRDELVAAGHAVPTGVNGLYGWGGEFEDIVDGISYAATAAAAEESAESGASYQRIRFSPVLPREDFEKTDYIASFPDLTGAISSFTGGDREHSALLSDRSAGLAWDSHLSPADIMLVSAACHPLYGRLAGTLPEGGVRVDVRGYCFRHEPSLDPVRLQAFRMHEFVRVGSESDAVNHRQGWIERGLKLLGSLELAARAVVANDPFFGRAGRILALGQRDENLKTELVVPLYGEKEGGTAVVSANCHREHFGENFGIHTADGGVAHSACVGFGVERIALALLRTHGMDVAVWPTRVREALNLDSG